jgi:hypothetical protein
LAPPDYYDVHEVVPDDWYAWTPTEFDCDPIASGGSCSYTFVNSEKVDVEACKLEDVDADPSTADDRIPVPGWTVQLTLNGAVIDEQLTGDDGCYVWEDLDPLAPPDYYDVHEVVPDDWYAWTPTEFDCDPIASGGTCSYTFVNSEKVDVTACKVEDLDGDLATDTDRLPLTLWTVKLSVEGEVVDTQLTGLDGCYTWEDLDPGVSYDVHEELLPGWYALTPTSKVWTAADATSGAELTYTFINSQEIGCTLTQGYWKTHSLAGPAPYDQTGGWANLGDFDGDGTPEQEGEDFFNTGYTWIEIFNTPPAGGNAYIILAHQWMAATLNSLKDDDPASLASVAAEMAQAEGLLTGYATTHNDLGVPYIPDDPDRATAIAIAETLDDFNNGLVGPPHCDD